MLLAPHTQRVQHWQVPHNKWTLLSLPNDTLVDLIFVQLCVRDILRLRRLCKLLYELTHQPVVWKRILRTLHLPLLPLPPTTKYSFPNLSSLETERLVIRAVTTEAIWRNPISNIKSYGLCANGDVMSLKIVPGGKYGVVSICQEKNRYMLMVLAMEHRVQRGYWIAERAVPTKAYKLEAKYMRYENEMGIMISYVRREPKRKRDRMAGVDVSHYSEDHPIDSPVPVRYELNVIHCPLSPIHVAEDPCFPPGSSAYTARIAHLPGPFRDVTFMRSNKAYDFTDFDVLDGAPYIIVVQGQLITFKNLVSRIVHCIRVGPMVEEVLENNPEAISKYAIRAIRVLPLQRELLVVRSDPEDIENPLALELYKIPDDSIPDVQAQGVRVAWPRSIEESFDIPALPLHVSISAVPCSTDGEDAVSVLTARAEPPPVSVYVVSRDQARWQTVQFRLWPKRIAKAEVGVFRAGSQSEEEMEVVGIAASSAAAQEHAPPPPPRQPVPLKDTTFRFELSGPFFNTIECTHLRVSDSSTMRILPGTTRPLFLSQADNRSATPALCMLGAYMDLMAPPAPDPRWPEDEASRAEGKVQREWIDAAMKSRDNPAANPTITGLPMRIINNFTHGLVTMEWDDWSMTLCGVRVNKPNELYIFQFVPTPTETPDGHRVPIPVPDVDERFREIPENDLFGMTGIES